MRRYSWILLGIVLGGLAATIGLNWLVNPYAIFDSPSIAGFNAAKPEIARRQRLAKPHLVRREQPDLIILGTSRALHIATAQPAWANRRPFNLALASSSLYEQLRYFQHALAVSEVHGALLGLDAFAFVPGRESGFREERLAADPAGAYRGFSLQAFLQDAIPSLLSFDALRSSLATIEAQPAPGAALNLHGDQAERVRRNGGHHRMFVDYENRTAQEPLTDPDDLEFDSYRLLLRTAYRNDIDLRLYISPEHARLQELRLLLGQGALMADWRREVVRINEEEAARARKKPFPLWDFGGFNSITTEGLPAPGDHDALMHWYWEDSHFTAATGALIVDRIYGSGHDAPPDFGVLLSGAGLEQHLQHLALSRTGYRQAHPSDVAELDAVIGKYRRRNPAPF